MVQINYSREISATCCLWWASYRPKVRKACCRRSAATSAFRSSNAAKANRVNSVASDHCALESLPEAALVEVWLVPLPPLPPRPNQPDAAGAGAGTGWTGGGKGAGAGLEGGSGVDALSKDAVGRERPV